jgi:hypothetical protein
VAEAREVNGRTNGARISSRLLEMEALEVEGAPVTMTADCNSG